MRLLLFLIPLFGLAHADQVDTRPLEAWLGRQGDIKTLQADFVQERKLAALKNPVSTPGTMTLVKGGSMRWNLGNPVKTTAISDGTTIQLIDIEKKLARSMSADSSRAKAFTLLGDSALNGGLNGFKEVFELVEAKMTDGIYQLTTRPRDRSLRKQLEWVFFDIDPKQRQLRALEVQLEDKSRIRTIFTRTRFNEAIPKGTFEFDLSGYKVR
jgi:outer membrane lipoprotein-sorting protein